MKEQLLATLETSRNYTIAVAEAMPDSGYTARPADGIWNFGELMQHIAYGIRWWEDNYIRGNSTEWDPPMAKGSRKDVLADLESAYAALGKTISSTNLDDEKVKGFHSTLDHITHHRGQAVIYLRYKGITPPAYTY